VTHVGPQYADDLNTIAEDVTGRVGEIEAYTLLDVSARYEEPRSKLGVFAVAKSVLDQPFIISRRPEGIHVSGFRQVTAGLTYRVD
jgi:Fe(3+) dicitrate transport protein